MSTHRCFAPLFSFDTLPRSDDGAQEPQDADYPMDDYRYPDGGHYYYQDGAYYDVDFSDVQE